VLGTVLEQFSEKRFSNYRNGAVFDLVTDSLKMAIYHDRKTVPPFKGFFKPSLEFNMMNSVCYLNSL
jgi:hypothetical protein